MKSSSVKRLRSTSISLSFLPPALILLYALFLFIFDTFELNQFIHVVLVGISIFGIIWAFFAVIFAWVAVRHATVGGILIVFAGALFFVTAFMSNHYVQIYLPASGIYFLGGILHICRPKTIPKRKIKPV
jgi:hypothetical protein